MSAYSTCGGIEGVDGTRDKAVLFEAPQRRGQYLLADPADVPLERIEATRPPAERADYQQRPLVTDPRKHLTDVSAARGIPIVTW